MTSVQKVLDHLARQRPCCDCCNGCGNYVDVVLAAFEAVPKEEWPPRAEGWDDVLATDIENARAGALDPTKAK